MRITAFLLLFSVIQVMGESSYSQNTRLSLNIKDVSIENVLDEIENQSEFYFLFNQKLVNVDRKVDIDVKNKSIKDILADLFAGEDVNCLVMDRQILLSPKYITEGVNVTRDRQPQEIVVTGKVTDEDGNPLPGVNILIKGTLTGTITNADGNYSIELDNPNATLVFSFVGHRTQEVAISGRAVINIILVEEAIGLEEVVAIGYGTKFRKEVTTSISKVEGYEISSVPSTSIATSMKGKFSGARIYNKSGAPGADAVINIRGGSSINKSNNPLVVIDGLPRSLNDINPQDIESIVILKDAASTAIYGARASNGIILVTTKIGKIGKMDLTANFSYGYQTPSKNIDYLNARQLLEIGRPAAAASRWSDWLSQAHPIGTGNTDASFWSTRYLESGESVPKGYQSIADPLDPSKTIIFQDNDVQNMVFPGGQLLNFHLSANGGTDNIKYAASIGYTDDEGIAIGSDWQRFNTRSNVDFQLNDKLLLTTKLDFTSSKSNVLPSERNVFSRSIHMPNTIKSVMPDGSVPGGKSSGWNNPVFIVENNSNTRSDINATLQAGLEYDVFNDLSAKVTAYYNPNYYTREYFQKENFFNKQRPSQLFGALDQVFQLDGLIQYDKTIANNHNLNVITGGSLLSYNLFNFSVSARGSSTDKIPTLNAASELISASSERQRERLVSAFGRVSYNFKSKYLASFSIRADGSSKFAEGNRLGVFPGLSVGWMVSQEPFMNSIPLVNMLKVRSSYGLTGNNSVGRYNYQGIYTIGSQYAGNIGAAPSVMSNNTLAWETTKQFDIGFDLSLWNYDRLMFLFDYYDKTTDNLLFNEPLPNTSGFNEIEKNVGKVRFWGYDVELKGKIFTEGDFKWDVGINFAYNMNKVLKLPDNGRDKNRIGGLFFEDEDGTGIGGIAEGERMYSIMGWKVDYLIDNQEQADNALYDDYASGYDPLTGELQRGRKLPGDFEWIDRNNDGDIDSYDRFVLGYQVPPITGGLSTNLSYKGFNLYTLFDYALGHNIYDNQISRINGWQIDGYTNPTTEALDAWKEPGDAAKTNVPRFTSNDADMSNNVFRTSDYNAYDGSYLCIREVRLSYDLPKELVNKMKLKNMKVYLTGYNLYYFTEFPGFVTEYSGPTNNYKDGNYPNPRQISIGININF